MLSGAPISMGEEYVKEVMKKELRKIEKGEDHKGMRSLNFEVAREYHSGIPWESEEGKKKNTSNSYA